MNGHTEEDVSASCEHVFDQFVTAVTCKAILTSFNNLIDLTGLRHVNHAHFYEKLKAKLKGSWKAQNLWAKLDKRASHSDYKKGQACLNHRVLIIGAGPCGLRTAIECALLGAKTVILEKRDRFSRNNVLHLWPFLITDLKNLGAKKFFGKFCAGAIDHISIRQLQCILLKVALLLGVEVHVNVSFEGLIEPPEDESLGVGWKCKVTPENHAASEYEFDALIGADGKRNTLSGFKRKEFRGKLAIAVTANFINRNSQAEARVQEISGVAFIFNQKFFTDLKERTRIDLENIVYYKDDTHYFVMTAKKASLLEKGVLKEDYSDTVALLDRSNVDQERLMAFAREAANFSTNYQLPSLDYAVNHYGQADVAMFDFTSMFAAENASRFILKNGHHLLMGLVGDSLLEPFWPTGSGCARGFLSAFDAAWMLRNWALGKAPLQVLAERESIYTILSQTTPNFLNKKHILFSIDPNTRYPNLNPKVVKPVQVRHLYEGGVFDSKEIEEEELAMTVPAKRPRNAEISGIDSYSLLRWCQRVLNTGKYRDVHVVDFTSSWRSGLALCALINSFRPHLFNNVVLMECDVALNNHLAFSTAEKELGIPPVLTGEEMAKYEVPDKLTMVSYLAQFYDLFKHEPLPSTMPLPVKAKRKSLSKDTSQPPKAPHSPSKRTSIFHKLSAKLAKSKKRKEQEENERSILGSKKLKEKEDKGVVELTRYSKLPMEEIANRFQLDRKTGIKVSKTEERSGAVSVTAMADLLVAKFKSQESKPPPEPIRKLRGQPSLLAATPASEFCSYCHKRVYIMERQSAEGEFFHRGCLKCDFCGVGLRLTSYTCDRDAKPVKFFCYRHTVPEQRVRPQRKRGLEDATENLPDLVVTPPPDVDTGQAPKEKTPRKAASAPLSPLLLPSDGMDMLENTPERIEFEISFDGQEEESEEEQFEHNLRASLSSDTLLDDEDSDSELSDSDIESGAEDDVWENAVESLKSPRTPLTLEQACELHGNWKRQHSHENLVGAVEDDRTPSRGPEYSRLLGENGEEEESSTEVEEDSEYETDDSSAEEDSEEDKTEPAQGVSAEDHLEVSLNSPSPVSRLSASKASFFSEPPKVVSLDPWSMFGMGKKPTEKEMEITEKVDEEAKPGRKTSATSSKKKSTSESRSSASEKKKSTDSKKDMSSKDTDASIESLELDIKSPDVSKSEHISPAGSLDELNEEFILDAKEEEQHVQGRDYSEIVEMKDKDIHQDSILSKTEESLEVDDDEDKKIEEGMENDDEIIKDNKVHDNNEEIMKDNKVNDNDEEDEILKKAALNHNMEQLLQDVDNKRLSKGLTPDQLLTESSETDENEMFLEGRLSPGSKKTRKPYVKCRTRHVKKLQKFLSTNSDSEAGRTDPTSTENSQRDSSGSQSLSLDSAEDLLQFDKISDKSQNNIIFQNNSPTTGSIGEKCLETNLKDLETKDSLTTEIEAEGEDDDCLRQVLESVAAMPDLSDNSDIDDLVFNKVDERFVTERRKKPTKKSSSKSKKDLNQKLNKDISDLSQRENKPLNESKSISSDSESPESFAEEDSFVGQMLDIEPGDDDIKPDQDMLRDYTTTLSLALGESYSDDLEDKCVKEEERDYTTTLSLALGESYSDDLEDKCVEEEEPVDTSVQINANRNDKGVLPDAQLEDCTMILNLALAESYSSEMEEKFLGEDELLVDTSGQKNVSNSDREASPDAQHEDVCNSNRSEQISITEDAESTVDNSSLYITPNASIEKHNLSAAESSNPASISTSEPLPIPRSNDSAPEIRQSTVDMINEDTSSNTQTSLSAHSSHKQDNRDSSGSDIFLTPAEITTESPFVNKITLSSQFQVTPLPHAPEVATSQLEESTPHKDSHHRNTQLLPLSTNLVSPSAKATPSSTIGSSQRKMPELPKLNIPKREIFQPSITDKPIMCSSPKLGSKLIVRTSPSNLKDSRALPIPDTSNKILKSELYTDSTTSKSAPTATKKDSFAKPASLPPKTKVPIDKSKLKLSSSSDHHESDHEIEAKKKISAEGIVINHTFDDDIPFADESEAEERFYTPSAPFNKGKPTFTPTSSDFVDARKKIVPSQLALQDADVSAQKTKSGRERSKIQPERKATTKMTGKHEIELSSTAPVVKRQPSEKSVDSQARLSASFDTNSASDVYSDKEDYRVQSATSSATEGDHKPQSTLGKGKKGKAKTQRTRKQKEISENISLAQDKSITTPVAIHHPGNTESNDSIVYLSSNITPKANNDNLVSKTGDRISNMNKTSDKKTRTLRVRSGLFEDLEKTPTSEGKRDLAICSVFHSEVSNRPSRVLHGVSAARRTLSLVPKASADEMSDSDESHISLSTMQRRRDEDLDDRVARRLRKIQQKQHKRAEQKRLRMAQEIQRQLEEVEVRQRELEDRGITVEKALRGDAPDDDVDESQLMSEWFSLVHEKNALLRYESELIVRAKELELEDRQARLETDFRERSRQPAKAGGPDLRHRMKDTKTEIDIVAEGHILDELLSVVEQRNSLVAMLEEDRLREEKEDSDLKEVMAQKGFLLSPLSFDTRRKKIEAPLATYAL